MLYYYLGATRIPFYHLALIIYPENDWLPGQIEIVPLLVLILILIKAIKYWYDSRKMFEYTRDRKRMRILYRNIVTLREGKLDHNQIEYLHGCVRQDVDFLIRDKNL